MKLPKEAESRLLELILDLAADSGHVGLFPHERFDADAIGAAVSLSRAFRTLGCQAVVLVSEPVPESLQHLPGLEELKVFPGEDCPPFDLALAIDCHDASRMGERGSCFLSAPVRGAIDHHLYEKEPGDLEWIEPQAASTSELAFEMIWDLELHLGKALFDPTMAILLLAGIITDTGRFSYSNTTPLCLRQAASLLERFEIDLNQLNYDLYERTSVERLQIKGDIFSTITRVAEGRILIACATQAMLVNRGAPDDELSNLASEIRTAEGSAAVLLLVESEDGDIRVSVRSNSCFDSAAFAGRFGGGGHLKAAGMTLKGMKMEEAAQLLSRESEAHLKACSSESAKE